MYVQGNLHCILVQTDEEEIGPITKHIWFRTLMWLVVNSPKFVLWLVGRVILCYCYAMNLEIYN